MPYDRHEVHGTTRGFVYLAIENGQTRLIGCDVEAIFSDRQVWAGEGRWTIIHIENITQTYGPFRLWSQLADPVTEFERHRDVRRAVHPVAKELVVHDPEPPEPLGLLPVEQGRVDLVVARRQISADRDLRAGRR